MAFDGDEMGFFDKLGLPGRGTQDVEVANVIDIDPLVAEITPEFPSGERDLEYDPAFIELEEKIKGLPEVEIGGKIVQEAKPPNWADIGEAAVALLRRTHDLRVAICLTRALLHTEGFRGLKDGLTLLQCFIERFWDTLYPQLDPEDGYDPTRRINIMMGLCDYDTVIAPLMGIPLCASPKMGAYSLRDIRIATGKLAVPHPKDKPAPEMTTIEAAFKDCDVTTLRVAGAAVRASLIGLNRLEELLQEKVGSGSAPDVRVMRQVIGEIEGVLSRQLAKRDDLVSRLPKKAPRVEKPAAAIDATPEERVSSQGVKPMNTINSRQDVVRMLDQICLFYDQNEPASPVPLLLRRAKQLVEKNFLEIIKDVAPESVAQIEKLIGVTKKEES
jgi:type VI secretion system protein ImpA